MNRWHKFAKRYGLGCSECGRRFFLKTQYCKVHLDKELRRAIREVYGKKIQS